MADTRLVGLVVVLDVVLDVVLGTWLGAWLVVGLDSLLVTWWEGWFATWLEAEDQQLVYTEAWPSASLGGIQIQELPVVDCMCYHATMCLSVPRRARACAQAA